MSGSKSPRDGLFSFYDWVVMIRAVFDESGTHAGAHLTLVSGLLFSNEGYETFREKWSNVLAPFDLKHPFHCSGCLAGDKEFDGVDPCVREALLKRLAEITAETRGPAFIAQINQAEYNAYMAENPGMARLAGTPYALCAMSVIDMVASYAEKAGIGLIDYAFETGNEKQAETFFLNLRRNKRLAEQRHVYGITFVSKTGERVFDAADFLGWEWQRNAKGDQDNWSPRMQVIQQQSCPPIYVSNLTPAKMAMQALFHRFYGLHR